MEINEELEKKMQILKELDTDDSRFLYRICAAYKDYNKEEEELRKSTELKQLNKKTNVLEGIINLDDIECSKYYNTKIKTNIERMALRVLDTAQEEFFTNKAVCKKIIYEKKDYTIDLNIENKINIVDLIKTLDQNKIKKVELVVTNISDENIFKYYELTKAMEIIQMEDAKLRNKAIYEYIYEYLNKDFISNKYCDFINNQCVAQRHFNLYPVSKKDGCCFKNITKCEHLSKGVCTVECLPCRLFS